MAVKYKNRNYDNFAQVIEQTMRDFNNAKNILIEKKAENLSEKELFQLLSIASKRVKGTAVNLVKTVFSKLQNVKINPIEAKLVQNKLVSVLKNIKDDKISQEQFEDVCKNTFAKAVFMDLIKTYYTASTFDNLISELKNDVKMNIENAKKGYNRTQGILNNNNANLFEKQKAWDTLPNKEKRLNEMKKAEKFLEQ